jgi:hypothetical protein
MPSISSIACELSTTEDINFSSRGCQVTVASFYHLNSVSKPFRNDVDGLTSRNKVAGKATSGIMDSASDTTSLHV